MYWERNFDGWQNWKLIQQFIVFVQIFTSSWIFFFWSWPEDLECGQRPAQFPERIEQEGWSGADFLRKGAILTKH